MDVVQDFFESRNELILHNLTDVGISREKSKNILILVSLSFSLTLKEMDVEDVLSMLIQCDMGKYLNQFDVEFMSQVLSMSREDVVMALEAIWPVVCGLEDNSHHRDIHVVK